MDIMELGAIGELVGEVLVLVETPRVPGLLAPKRGADPA